MRKIELKIIQRANYENCDNTDRVTIWTGMIKLTRPNWQGWPDWPDPPDRPGWPDRPEWPKRPGWPDWPLTRLTRLTRQIFPPDRIQEDWCENCKTCDIANLQFRWTSEWVTYGHQCKHREKDNFGCFSNRNLLPPKSSLLQAASLIASRWTGAPLW